MDNLMDKIVQCPNCAKEVKDGDRIWLDGECLCPDCYKAKRDKYDELIKYGYEQCKKDYHIDQEED